VKSSNDRDLDKEARRILLASGALGAVAGLLDLHFRHPVFALMGFAAGILAVLLYPWKERP